MPVCESDGGDKQYCEFLIVDLLTAEQRLVEAENRLQLIDPDDSSEEQFVLITKVSLRVEQRRSDEAAKIFASLSTDKGLSVKSRHRRQYLKARIDAAAGKTDNALAAARDLVDEARGLGHLPLELNAGLRLGVILIEAGDTVAGRADLSRVAARSREIGLHALADRPSTSNRAQGGPVDRESIQEGRLPFQGVVGGSFSYASD